MIKYSRIEKCSYRCSRAKGTRNGAERRDIFKSHVTLVVLHLPYCARNKIGATLTSYLRSDIMTGEVFNANPTIYTSSKPYKSRSALGPKNSLWIGDVEEENDDSDEVEPIDQDEIFGLSML